jgi:predicted N-acetyltransferase YhbS
MGFDVWGNGSEKEYLEDCRTSAKYARGVWYVLEGDSGELVSSLVVYCMSPGEYGIGSLATPPELRKQGHASRLMLETLKHIEQESPNAIQFLYSDIEPAFYERFHFQKIPQVAQRYETTTCMVRNKTPIAFTNPSQTPEYF